MDLLGMLIYFRLLAWWMKWAVIWLLVAVPLAIVLSWIVRLVNIGS